MDESNMRTIVPLSQNLFLMVDRLAVLQNRTLFDFSAMLLRIEDTWIIFKILAVQHFWMFLCFNA